MKAKLIDFKFEDFRDWFIPKENQFNYIKKDILIIEMKRGNFYEIEVPCNVAFLRIFVPENIDDVRRCKISFKNNIIMYSDIIITSEDKGCLVGILSAGRNLIETMENVLRIRTWANKQWKNVNSFEYEMDIEYEKFKK